MLCDSYDLYLNNWNGTHHHLIRYYLVIMLQITLCASRIANIYLFLAIFSQCCFVAIQSVFFLNSRRFFINDVYCQTLDNKLIKFLAHIYLVYGFQVFVCIRKKCFRLFFVSIRIHIETPRIMTKKGDQYEYTYIRARL